MPRFAGRYGICTPTTVTIVRMTGMTKAGVYSKAIGLTSLNPVFLGFFEGGEIKRSPVKSPEIDGPSLIGSAPGYRPRAPGFRCYRCFFLLALAGSISKGRAEEPPVRAWKLGEFTLYAAFEPFRLSWFHDGKLLLAQRGRRTASLEFLDGAGWHALTKVIGHQLDSHDAGRVRITFEVATEAGRKARVDASWSSGESGVLVSLDLEGDSPPRGAPEDGREKALAVRDDFVSYPGERFIPVPWPRPLHPGEPLPLFTGKESSPGPTSENATSGERILFSSRNFALWIPADASGKVTALAPDPDTLRVEAAGPRLKYRLLPGAPREVLRGGALSAKTKDENPALVDDWAALRRWVDAALIGSFLDPGHPLEVLVQPKEGAKEEAARELVHRAFQAAVLLPHLKLSGPAAFSPSEDWLRSVADRLGGSVRPGKAPERVELLFVEFPLDPEAWRTGDEWLIDGSFLAAPILEEGKLHRDVYFPEGAWTDLRKSAAAAPVVRGPARLNVEISLGESVALWRLER